MLFPLDTQSLLHALAPTIFVNAKLEFCIHKHEKIISIFSSFQFVCICSYVGYQCNEHTIAYVIVNHDSNEKHELESS